MTIASGKKRIRRKKRLTRTRGEDTGQGIVKTECECDPLFSRLCDRIRADKRQIVSHIQESSTRLSHRLDSLEQRTRHEVSGDQYHQHGTVTNLSRSGYLNRR